MAARNEESTCVRLKQHAPFARLSCGLGAEHSLKPRPGKLHPDHAFPALRILADVRHTPLRMEIRIRRTHHRGVDWYPRNANLQVRADGHIETRAKRDTTAAQILAGCV